MTTNRNQKFHLCVQKLLTNKRYIGENHFKDIVDAGQHPGPSWTRDLFEEVQLKNSKEPRMIICRHKAAR